MFHRLGAVHRRICDQTLIISDVVYVGRYASSAEGTSINLTPVVHHAARGRRHRWSARRVFQTTDSRSKHVFHFLQRGHRAPHHFRLVPATRSAVFLSLNFVHYYCDSITYYKIVSWSSRIWKIFLKFYVFECGRYKYQRIY